MRSPRHVNVQKMEEEAGDHLFWPWLDLAKFEAFYRRGFITACLHITSQVTAPSLLRLSPGPQKTAALGGQNGQIPGKEKCCKLYVYNIYR